MANAPPPMKVNRNAGKGQAPAAPPAPAFAHAPAAAHPPAAPYPPADPPPPAAPPAAGPSAGVAVPRLEPTLPEGLRLGAFEIKGVIAHSRVAVIYRVSDHSLGIPAAIKEYMPLGVARRGSSHQVVPIEAWHEDTIDLGRRAFFAESRALARCDDPALLRVTQLWEINGTAYRVMPLYSGKRLVDLRREMKAPIGEAAIRAMLERLLDALGAYHASAGVHGNVTPMNILMPALDRPVLLGPGKASVLLATELGEPVRSDFEAAFAAPEQHEAADAAVIGPSADLFGLAQTLRYCITGAAPIGHESLRASIHRLLGAGVVPNYSDALLDALSSATATAPAERPQSLDEFRQRLRRLEAQGAAVAVASALSPAPVPPPAATGLSPHAESAVPPRVPDNGDADETIDVSSVLGDLLQEPTEPPLRDDDTLKPDAEPARGPRVEPSLNFAFDAPVPPVHEPPGHPAHGEHGAHAPRTAPPPSHVHVEQHRPHPPEPPEPPSAPDRAWDHMSDRTSDRTSAYHTAAYDDGSGEQLAASYRPKRPLLTSAVLRMSGFVIAIAALAVVVILAVSGVWDPRGPDLDLRPTATPGRTAVPPDAPPTPPIGDVPAAADTAPPAVAAETPTASAAPPPIAAPPIAAPTASAPAPVPTHKPAATATAPTQRDNNASRRRGSTPTTEAVSDPSEACAGRTQFALYRCMQAQCARSRWAAHPECVRLRKSDRVEPP